MAWIQAETSNYRKSQMVLSDDVVNRYIDNQWRSWYGANNCPSVLS